MAHLDSSGFDDSSDYHDRSESGRTDGTDSDRSPPWRRAPRHARTAQQPSPSTADYWDSPPGGPFPEPAYPAPGGWYGDSGPSSRPLDQAPPDQRALDQRPPGQGPRRRRRHARPEEPAGPESSQPAAGVSSAASASAVPGGSAAAGGSAVADGTRSWDPTETAALPAAAHAAGDTGAEPAAPAVPAEAGKRQSRAGRNLPAAIGVGLGLGGAVLASLLLWRPAFVIVVVLAVGVATWEMVRAVRTSGVHPPLVPLLAGGPVMAGLAWFGGAEVLTLGLVATALAVAVWRIGDGAAGYQRDVTTAVFVATYVPFLAAFAVLLNRPPDGAMRVLAMIASVVISDTGGYLFGVLFGKHPMAPSVSPKKSWEGLGGSLLCTAFGGAMLLHYLLDTAWWHGVVFGIAVSLAAVLGDLAESLLKRDLQIKDMSTLLPGHGGLMDRVDSILLAAPTAYAVLLLLVPVAG